MSVTDVRQYSPGFWEIGNYRHNIKRIKDGVDQLDDFSKMCKERADIETKYVKMLQMFANKWSSHVEKTMTSCAVRTVWTEVISESDALAAQHSRVRDRLLDEIMKALNLFRKENHHPSAFRAPKEIREIEEGFEKAQRQWKKLYEKCEAAKKNYHSACRTERSAYVQLANSQADTSVSMDGKQKIKDRHTKATQEVERTKNIYENQVKEISDYKGPYMENMSFVFAKCQQMELKRLKFFVEMIDGMQKVLVGLIKNDSFFQLHSNLEQLLANTKEDALDRDLSAWSATYGIDAQCAWPIFEEYRPEIRQIHGSRKETNNSEMDGVILTRQIIKSEDMVLKSDQSLTQQRPTSSTTSDNDKSSDSDTNTFDSRKTGKEIDKDYVHSTYTPNKMWEHHSEPQSDTPDSSKYADFDDYISKQATATVLYDYLPIEEDEIALHKGETIEVLSEPDSLGWCTGRKNGRTGLFPASYVHTN